MTTDKKFYGYSLNKEQIEIAAGEVLSDIARHLNERNGGDWVGLIDVQNAMLHALRDLEATRAIVLWNPRNGLDVAPRGLMEQWASRLAALAESGGIDRAALARAVSAALLDCYGLGGGSLLVFRDGWRLTIHPLAYDHTAPVIVAVKNGRPLAQLPGVN